VRNDLSSTGVVADRLAGVSEKLTIRGPAAARIWRRTAQSG